MKKATIYDYARMCKKMTKCNDCPLSYKVNKKNIFCDDFMLEYPDEANESILKWCEEHPIETRQDSFLKMFPNTPKDENEILNLCPNHIDTKVKCFHSAEKCDECCKKYWLAEVDDEE